MADAGAAALDVGEVGLNTPTFAACISALVVIGLSILFFIRSYLGDSQAAARLADINTKMAVMKARQPLRGEEHWEARMWREEGKPRRLARRGGAASLRADSPNACWGPRSTSSNALSVVLAQATSGNSRTLMSIATVNELLAIYGKPMLASLADFQAALYMQVGAPTRPLTCYTPSPRPLQPARGADAVGLVRRAMRASATQGGECTVARRATPAVTTLQDGSG